MSKGSLLSWLMWRGWCLVAFLSRTVHAWHKNSHANLHRLSPLFSQNIKAINCISNYRPGSQSLDVSRTCSRSQWWYVVELAFEPTTICFQNAPSADSFCKLVQICDIKYKNLSLKFYIIKKKKNRPRITIMIPIYRKD